MPTLLDSIYNNSENTDPKTSPQKKKTLLDDVFNTTSSGAATDIQLGQYGVGDSQYDTNVTPENVVNLEEIRAQKQSALDKWSKGLLKATGTFGTSVLENTAGVVIGMGSAIIENDISKLYNNPFAQSLDEFNQYLSKVAPNYHTKAEEDYNLIQKLGTSNFWSDQVLGGAAYLAGAAATGSGLSRFASLGKLVKAGKIINEAELLTKGGQALDKAAQGIKLVDAVDFAKNAGLMSYGESSIEARGIYNDTKNSLIEKYKTDTGVEPDASVLEQIEKDAKSAGNFGFATNLAITGTTNALLFPKLLSKGYNANKLGLNNITLQGEKFVAEQTPLTKSVGKELLKGSLEEGGQELGQLATQKTLTDYYSKGYQNRGEKAEFVNSLIYGLGESLGTEEGLESFFLGALLGGPAGAVQARGDINERNLRTEQLAATMNTSNFKKTINSFDNFVRATNYETEKEEALATGSKFDYLNAEHDQNKTIVKQFLDNDGKEILIQQYKDMQGLPEEEFKKIAGYDLEKPLPTSQTQIIDNAVKFVENLDKTNQSVKQLFPYSEELHGNSDNYNVLTTNLWHYSTSIDNMNSRINTISNDIFKIASEKNLPLVGDGITAPFQVADNPLVNAQIQQLNDDLGVAKLYKDKLIESYNLLSNPKTQKVALTDIIVTAEQQVGQPIVETPVEEVTTEPITAEQQLEQLSASENEELSQIDPSLPEEAQIQLASEIKGRFDTQRQELAAIQQQEQIVNTINAATSTRELDAILDQLDAAGSTNSDVLTQINIKREELLQPKVETPVQAEEPTQIDPKFGNQRKRAQTIWKTTAGQDNDKKLPEQRYFRFLENNDLPKDAKLQIVTRFNNKELFDQLLDEGAKKYEEKTGIDTIYTVLVDGKGIPVYSNQKGEKLESGDVNNLVYGTLLTENGVKGTSLTKIQLAKDDLNALRANLLERTDPNVFLNVTEKSKGIAVNNKNGTKKRNIYLNYDPRVVVSNLENTSLIEETFPTNVVNNSTTIFVISEEQLQSIEETIDNPLFSEELKQELTNDLKNAKSPSDLGKLFKKICTL